MVHESLGPTGGAVSQNWVCRKWPDGWLTQHVLTSCGGDEGHDSDGGMGQRPPGLMRFEDKSVWWLLMPSPPSIVVRGGSQGNRNEDRIGN